MMLKSMQQPVGSTFGIVDLVKRPEFVLFFRAIFYLGEIHTVDVPPPECIYAIWRRDTICRCAGQTTVDTISANVRFCVIL